MPRILITGAAGFLGSHLCDRFIREGYDVVGMDNLITGDLRNLEHLFPKAEFTFYNQDVSDYIHVAGPLDYILHFASPASPIDYLKIPIQTLKVGSLGTHNCLGLAKEKGARILVAGRNFGCGSSREHAPWAIQDFGFDVVIAPSFADIFRTNCTKIGMLPVVLPEDDVRTIMREALDQPGIEMTVDLEECAVALPDGRMVEFHIEDSVRDRLLNGWDDIGLTLRRSEVIDAYEADREREGPVTTILL